MLVHVERKNRSSTGKAVRVVCRPLVDQPAQALGPGKDRPAGTARQRLCHRGKFRTPSHDAAKIALEGVG